MHRVLCGRRNVVVNDAERVVARLYAGVRALVVLLKVDVFQHRAPHRRHFWVAGEKKKHYAHAKKIIVSGHQTLCMTRFFLVARSR